MNPAAFLNGAELVDMLLAGWEIEKRFEGVSYGESERYASTARVKKIMPYLVGQSTEHEYLVKSMIQRVKTDRQKWDFPQRVSKFPFHLSWDEEMMKEILRVERKAMETYADILARLQVSDTKAFLDVADREFLVNGLKKLVMDEEEHARLAQSAIAKPGT